MKLLARFLLALAVFGLIYGLAIAGVIKGETTLVATIMGILTWFNGHPLALVTKGLNKVARRDEG